MHSQDNDIRLGWLCELSGLFVADRLKNTVSSRILNKAEFETHVIPVELQASGLKVPNAGEGT